MEYTQLGLTDLQVSRVCFGCWTMGKSRWGQVSDRDSIAAVREALDLGINFFDTADVYGLGHAEEILSRAIGKPRSEVVIATKFGLAWDREGNTRRDCSPRRIVEALEGSLRRLKLDCIPLYQIHWPDPKTPIADTLEALRDCQRAGKVRYIGCCNFSSNLMSEAQDTLRLETLQIPYNLADRSVEADMLRYCRQQKVAVLAYSPLVHGLLSGKYGYKTRFGDNDFRSRDENFRGERLERNLALVNRLKELGARHGKTPSQVAIRWVLENPAITAVIAGIRRREQIIENSGALSFALSHEEREFLSLT